ncbi:NAD(P)-dependent oxidoreductase [Vaginisenegalia massiliensis]|uniref:NAD(P)-dependent oxidoreductase n=1 Tax=Vaginisenegalia massiliensis TaxID=2058294 RepID=UPI000F539CD4|nr:NAD(P)-dependent oxidoreductase [Vaginisenegalia massiliensis]
MTKIGFIGLGVMGSSMAKHLLAAGHDLVVYNRTRHKAEELLAMGATWADNPRELTQQVDVVMTIVGYPQDVEQVYFDHKGIFEGSRPGQLLIDLTTSTPSLAKKIAQEAERHGLLALDAPVSGGDLGAKEGRLTVMVGGSQVAFKIAEPLLSCFAQKVRLQGEAGAGQHTKMANQIMIAATMIGMVELLVYAKAAGLDPEAVIDTVGAGSAGNWSLANYGPRILKEDYSPGFFAKHFLKDLKIAIDEAQTLKVDLPGTKLALLLYEQLCHLGYENQGTQALIKLWWK